MANLKTIRIRINSVRSTRQITSAMKMVAAAKLRKAQDKLLRLRPYAGKLHEILGGLSQSLASLGVENVYGRVTPVDKVLIVVITSNKGLCGAFNSNVIKEARRLATEKYSEQFAKGNVTFLNIGKKGSDIFKKLDVNLLPDKNYLVADLKFNEAVIVAQELMDSFINNEYNVIELVYNKFKNTAVQELTSTQFLPIKPIEDEESISIPPDYIYEPNKEEIVRELIPKSLKIQFYNAVLDSFVSENGARMTAMHTATDNATTLLQDLTLQYNKARQASITNQIIEVASGAEALKG
ncbi:MAG TPA: ATP synthase F1 subunit gamma [Bacteroidetes bacterium]|jgi:F-type H+-transporting ATPase subunit gamma|nr:ATP synthase F1 subunit gamma [Bacteroidota bacterium]